MRATKRDRSIVAQTVLILFFCAGIAFLGLLSGGEHPSADARQGLDPMGGYFGPDMPRYPGSEEIPAGPSSGFGGSSTRMSFYLSEEEPAKIGRFYANFWRERKFFVREDITHMGGVVSAVNPKEDTVLQILMSRQSDRTAVFPSVTSNPLEATQTETRQPPIPLFPESRTLLTFGSDESEARAKIFLSLNEGGLAANIEHYSRVLVAAGFKSDVSKQPKLEAGTQMLLYRKGEREITVHLAALDKKRVRVHIMEVSP
jgi:hypothetical protein